MSYRICVLGESLRKAYFMMDVLCEENEEQIYRRISRDRAIMTDGTELVAKSIDANMLWDGVRFDEVFFDTSDTCYDWRSLNRRCDVILNLQMILDHSAVPPELQWWPVDC